MEEEKVFRNQNEHDTIVSEVDNNNYNILSLL